MNHPDTADETTCNERIESRELLVFLLAQIQRIKTSGEKHNTKGMYQYLCAGVMILLWTVEACKKHQDIIASKKEPLIHRAQAIWHCLSARLTYSTRYARPFFP